MLTEQAREGGVTQSEAYSRNGISWWNVIAFVVPTFQFVQIPLVGQLIGTEVALLVLAPWLFIIRGRYLFETTPRNYLILGAFWLFAQIFTDLFHDIPINDLVRGWAKIGLALINFVSLYLLIYGQRRQIFFFSTGLVVGGILTFYLNPNPLASYYPWKFGIGIPLSLMLVLISSVINVSNSRSIIGICILIVGAIVNIYLDYRSLGGIMGLTACYQGIQLFRGRGVSGMESVSLLQVVFLVIAVGVASFAMEKSYKYAIQKGILGDASQQKYEMQAYGKLGIIIGGRSEILAAFQAIADSPLFGHGSWAKDCFYTDLLIELKRRLGYYPGAEYDDCVIPSHSHIFGAWVEAGVMGAVFWLWVLTFPVRVIMRLYQTNERMLPLISFFAFLLIWDLFFSPYGLDLRYRTLYEAVIMMSFLNPMAIKK